MSDVTETLVEEAFAFPKYAGFIYTKPATEDKKEAYAMGFVKQLHVSQVVPVRVGLGDRDQTVYEYDVKTEIYQAVMLRSAWLRPVGSMDGARPLTIQVLVDGDVVMEQPIDKHLESPSLIRRPCACNLWMQGMECKCSTTPLEPSPVWPFDAVGLDTEKQALRDRLFGIFLPTKTLVQIRVVKPGRGPVEFQARCGITAALYSTKTSDIMA